MNVLLMCFSVCWSYGDKEDCYYTLRNKCETYESICVETETRKCKNVVQTIGPNDIVPTDYKPMEASSNGKKYSGY